MARATGANAKLYMAKEPSYGTFPSTGHRQMPFFSFSLGSSQALTDANILGVSVSSRDAGEPFLDGVEVTGDAEVPIDQEGIGHWLRLLFGPPVTSGAGPDYVHTFTSGTPVPPSNGIEIAYQDIARFVQLAGVMASEMEIEFSVQGPARARVSLLGQGETSAGTSGAGTITQLGSFLVFNQFQGSVKRAGSSVGAITAATLTYSNGLEAVRTIRSDGKIEGVDPGLATAGGSLTVRYEDDVLMNLAVNSTNIDLEFAYTLSATRKLVFTMPKVRLPKPKREISGPGGIEQSYDIKASGGGAAMLTVALHNGVAGAAYA